MARNVTDMVFKLYGHDETASKALKGVGKEAQSVGDQFKHFGKVAGAGFLAVGAAAGAFAVEAVHAAMKVEAQQKQLDIALKNNAHATAGQTKAVNDYLEKIRLQYGISNEKLIPSFAKLTRATGDVTKSQGLLKLAMDISAATGKPLEATSQALSKAYTGNLGALTRLGIPMDKNIIKSKDFNAAVGVLTKTFQGSADASTKTFSGKMAILTENFGAAKEKIGQALLPMLTKFINYIISDVLPYVKSFIAGLTGDNSVAAGADHAHDSIKAFGEGVRGVIEWISKHKHIVVELAAAFAAFWAVGKVGSAVSAFLSAFGLIKKALVGVEVTAVSTAAAEDAAAGPAAPALMAAQAIAAGAVFAAFGLANMWNGIAGAGKPTAKQKNIQSISGFTPAQQANNSATVDQWVAANSPTSAHAGLGSGMIWFNGKAVFERPWMHLTPANQAMIGSHTVAPGTTAGRAADGQPGGPPLGHRAVGGSVAHGTSYLVGENGPELFTPAEGGSITRSQNLRGALGGMNVVVNVSGSVIHERDLAVTVRDHIAQLMRRRGLDPAILGV
jgi:hypothetical protein